MLSLVVTFFFAVYWVVMLFCGEPTGLSAKLWAIGNGALFVALISI